MGISCKSHLFPTSDGAAERGDDEERHGQGSNVSESNFSD